MRASVLPFLVFCACGPAGATIGEDTDAPGADSDPADTDVGDTDGADTDPDPAPDYAQAGAHAVGTSSGSLRIGDCDMEYDLFRPDGVESDTLVVLSHGFARSRANVAGHGQHLASWGLHVVTPDLCHASMWDTDHAQNGRDLAGLAGGLGYAKVVYAGHSAGGLASVIAASQDPDALGAFALDGTDNENLGVAAASALEVPLGGLVAEPSTCNSENNGIAWYAAAPEAVGLRVNESDHCNYEDPTDWACTSFCETANPTFSDEALADTIRGLTTAWLAWRTGTDPRGEQWWSTGEAGYEQLVAGGAISPL
jgi:pimeloyl-ACP methyl ester carboxylesterase